MLDGNTKRRVLSSLTAGIILVGGLMTYVAYGTSFNVTNMQAAQISIDTGDSDTQLQSQIRTKADGYIFNVAYPNNTNKTFTLQDAGITINEDGSVSQIRQAVRHLGWQRFAWWQTTTVPLVINKNVKQFEAFTTTNIAIANKPATDATIGVKDGKAVVTDDANGSSYQIKDSNKRLVAAATSLQPLSATLEPTVVKPAISRGDLKNVAAKIDGITNHKVSFLIGDRTVIVPATEVGNWLDIQPIPEEKTADVSVNSGKVSAYVDKISAGSIYTSKAQVSTTDASGSVTVLSTGRNGSAVANKAIVAKNITNQLQQPDSVITAKLEVTEDPFKTVNAGDYPKWLVADVKAKRMYAYEHNQLIRTFLISGGAPKTPTVLGTYQIYNKLPIRTMRGANADGSRYEQPDVKYVNYFYKDYAVHGNYWRPSSVFGNVNTSHGCIGITDSDAEWIYNWAPIGTTVITHD